MNEPIFAEASFLTSDQTRIHYRLHRGTSADTVVFVHGLGGNRTAWTEYELAFAAQGMTTISADLRGHGKSDKAVPAERLSLERMARDIQELSAHENCHRIHLVGHCVGATVALHLASQLGADLKSLVVMSPYFRTESLRPAPFRWFLEKLTQLFERLPIPMWRRHFFYLESWQLKRRPLFYFYLRDWVSNPFSLYHRVAGHLDRERVETLASRIQVPALVYAGSRDTYVPPAYCRYLAELIPGSRYREWPSDHVLCIRLSTEMIPEISEFIQENQAS